MYGYHYVICLDHLIELHARGDAGEVAALIDGGKGVVEVVEALGVRPGAGGVAELDVGELAGGKKKRHWMKNGQRCLIR